MMAECIYFRITYFSWRRQPNSTALANVMNIAAEWEEYTTGTEWKLNVP
jgi:hypothetical protein